MAGRSQANLHLNYPEGLRGTSLEAKVLYTRLLCDDALNHAGILPLRAALWADECEMSEGAIDKALRELEDKRYAYTDYKTHQVLVRTLVRNDGIADMPNVLWSACRCALNLRSRKLRRVLATELRKLAAQPPDKVNENTGKRYVYPDPHGTAAAIDPGPPDSTETHDEPSHRTLPGTLPNPSEGSPTPGGGGGGGGKSSSAGGSSSKSRPEPRREDVHDLCKHLQDRLIANKCKPPTAATAEAWRREARLMLDKDKRDLAQAHQLIDWSTNHYFWKSKVLGMPKFRQQYDQLRLQAQEEGGLRHLNSVPADRPDLRTFEDYLLVHAAREAAQLIRKPYVPDPKPPSDKTSHQAWEQQQADRWLDAHATEIRAALTRKETA